MSNLTNLRIDPANKKGIHLVDIQNGYERVYIPLDEINTLIEELKKVKKC